MLETHVCETLLQTLFKYRFFYTSAPGQMRTREDGGGRFGRGGGG